MRRTASLIVALVLAGLLPQAARAQAGGAAAPARVSARREGSLVSVSGRPTVLMWAAGLSDPGELEQYRESGLNTVYLPIGETSQERLAAVSQLASAAEEAGLMVVLSLAPRPLWDESGNQVPFDPDAEGYADAVQGFVQAVADGVGDHPRLVAWAVEVPPADVVTGDGSFVDYLKQWYPSVGAVNDSWGTDYGDWGEITLGAARDIDSANPKGLGRASLDYAYYRQSVYKDAVSLWASALQAADPGRMVFLANLPDYRSIISAPPAFDGLVLSVYPSVAEGDWNTHNAHAVDMARRANQLIAVQTLETTADTAARQLTQWAGVALAHGASGIAFSSWPALRDSEDLRGAVAYIQEMVRRQAYPAEPKAAAAILYEPFAGGTQGRAGSLYGYIDGFAPGTPTNLFDVARSGSRYGLLDVLDSDSVTTVDLSRYGAIFAPMAFFLTTDAQVALQNYVLRGGALVVDEGVAMYQADGTVTSMPAVMREILGMRYEDLTTLQGRTPRVEHGEVYNPAQPTEVERLSPGQAGKEVDPALTRFVQQIEDFVTRADVAQYLGDNFVGEAGQGFRVSGLGEGFAVYSPDFLYENWDASAPYFDEFHDRVLGYRSDMQIIDPDQTWPGVAATLYDDWSVGVASPDGTPVSVLLNGARNQLYLVPSGVAQLGNLDEADQIELVFPGQPLARAVPLPIYLYPSGEGAWVSVSVRRYGREGIQLLVSGGNAASQVQNGQVVMSGGSWTPVDIEIRSGAYGMAANSVHRVTIQQGQAAGAAQGQEMMPDPDTGSLAISATVLSTVVTITPSG